MHCNTIPAVAFVSIIAAAQAQQLYFAQNDNATYSGSAVGWPAAVLAFRFTAQTNGVVNAAQVFTGNQPPATHTLELRTHDTVTGKPGTLLGGQGSWLTLHSRCWQGPSLSLPVALTAGQDYWLVWRISGMFHQNSTASDTNPGNVLVDTWVSDGTTWQTHTQSAAKFRLFVTAPVGTVQAFGTGKPGQYGDPQIGISGLPARGGVVDVWLDNAARRQLAALLIGQPTALVFPFATIWTTADVLLLLQTTLQSNPSNGGADYSFFIPNVASVAGFPLTFQWAIFDPLAADGIAHSAAITTTPP
ncbi:MAG: hypothetical protein WCR59_04915 [Planctomycetota bacterium]